jgi:hypothetical protein
MTVDYDTLDSPEDMEDADIIEAFLRQQGQTTNDMWQTTQFRDNHCGDYTGKSLLRCRQKCSKNHQSWGRCKWNLLCTKCNTLTHLAAIAWAFCQGWGSKDFTRQPTRHSQVQLICWSVPEGVTISANEDQFPERSQRPAPSRSSYTAGYVMLTGQSSELSGFPPLLVTSVRCRFRHALNMMAEASQNMLFTGESPT